MRLTHLSALAFVLFISPLFCYGDAKSSNTPPSTGDIREEQRLIGIAYLGDATFQIAQARERVGMNNMRLAQQSGLWALEQLAYAKRRLESHAARIETMVNWLGIRVSEGTRRDYRESYAKLRQRYVEVENSLETVALRLESGGFPILNKTLNSVRASSGQGAVNAVNAALAQTGTEAKGGAIENTETSTNNAAATSVKLPDGTAISVTPKGVSIKGIEISGAYDSATKTVQSPAYGKVSLDTARTNASNVTFIQTEKGVLVVPPGDLIAGAKLNPDGTITYADGSVLPVDNVTVSQEGQINVRKADGKVVPVDPDSGIPGGAAPAAASGPATSNASTFSDKLPANIKLARADGTPITVDGDAPPFQNGQRTFVRKVYLGGANALLQRETRVEQRLLDTGGDIWKVEETLGESRAWSHHIAVADMAKASGGMSVTFKVTDTSGATNYIVNKLTVQDDAGKNISVQPVGSTGGYQATISKDGDYTAIAEGSTDWGSVFTIEATFPIGVN